MKEKNIITFLKIFSFCLFTTFFVSCSEEATIDNINLEPGTSVDVETDTSTMTPVDENQDTETNDAGTATYSIDFKSLRVETSWTSNDTSDRDDFDAADIDDEDWMDVLEDGKVMMKCFKGDSHRTEVKEKPGTEQSLEAYRKMEYKSNLYNIPENGITIAQVHSRASVKRPWVRVFVDDDNVIKIRATETTPDESKSTYETYTGVSYTSGDDLHIIVEIESGDVYFYMESNGSSYNVTLTPSSAWDNFSSKYYFKAGVYTEGDDVEPRMEFKEFDIVYTKS